MTGSVAAKRRRVPPKASDPLDVVEDAAEERGWEFERQDLGFAHVILEAEGLQHQVSCSWIADENKLIVLVYFGSNITPGTWPNSVVLLDYLNERTLFGSFFTRAINSVPRVFFRYDILFPQLLGELVIGIIEDAFLICSEAYPLLEKVAEGQDPHEVFAGAMFCVQIEGSA